ncbi:Branched-chain-amino-acid aminotransferase TOXF [Venustampulla echinocandica]|uniref:Branched-chain-amino-acid aminotransferase TOXF n=1 Tax=Venustampulla echinocandica TaxID=2656787 RepID=A0A370T9Y0_9HELO|nr:Branched-chain-amino-acid aminotransferase TOXF [Venustampulla echinocandica]RDL30474.1 Branched-chain-amino-acid aminotransferase TOXF [Venustampulla echinocandica]
MSFPPPSAKNVDWSKLSIAVTDIVNGHVESRYSVETQKWSDPVFVKDPYLRVHGLAPAFNYGQQAYEGLKAYRSAKNEILLFRPDFHARRLSHSSTTVSIPPIPEDHVQRCVSSAVANNAAFVPPHSSGGALYIRPVVFGTAPHLALTSPSEFLLCVYVQPFGTYHGTAPLDALILEGYDRAAPRGTGNAKVGGNYAPAIKWTDAARAEGYPVTLHLDSQTRTEVEEFSTSGFVGVKIKGKEEKVTLVLPDSKNIIESVTSDSVVQIARGLGWDVQIRAIKYPELPEFNEVLACGTAAALVPIRSITCKSAGDKFHYDASTDGKEAGDVCKQLFDHLNGVQRGDRVDEWGWTRTITEEDLLDV